MLVYKQRKRGRLKRFGSWNLKKTPINVEDMRVRWYQTLYLDIKLMIRIYFKGGLNCVQDSFISDRTEGRSRPCSGRAKEHCSHISAPTWISTNYRMTPGIHTAHSQKALLWFININKWQAFQFYNVIFSRLQMSFMKLQMIFTMLLTRDVQMHLETNWSTKN